MKGSLSPKYCPKHIFRLHEINGLGISSDSIQISLQNRVKNSFKFVTGRNPSFQHRYGCSFEREGGGKCVRFRTPYEVIVQF